MDELRKRETQLLPDLVETALHHFVDDILTGEAHLDVDLRELGLPVGAEVLVAEAARDLEVAVVPAHHEQLLVDLRRLRQRVELARVHAAGHEIVARALGGGLDQQRGLDFEEALSIEVIANELDHLVAQLQVALHTLAAQVQVAVL